MFDPVGKTVKMEIMLDWNLGLPSGKVMRDLTGDSRLVAELRKFVPFLGRTRLYLIQLDVPLDLTQPRGRWPFARAPETRLTRFVLLEVRNPDRLEDEFNGRTVGEFGAPVLVGIPRVDALTGPVIDGKRGIWPIGPVRVLLIR